MNSSEDLSSIIDSPRSTDSLILIESSSVTSDSYCHSSSSTNDTSSITLQSSHDPIYDAEKIKSLLLKQKEKYQILKNDSPTDAQWWRAFGFPSQLYENNVFKKIPDFISCLKCMHTVVYKHSNGTKRYKEHADKCFPLATSSMSTSFGGESSSITQTLLDQMGFKKSVKLNEKDILKMKNLSAEWICSDLRPFSIMDDFGLRNLAQECIRLGHSYGLVNVDDVLRGRHTMSRHIASMADDVRVQVREMLSIPLEQHSLTISPDYWCDRHKQISYLGVNATFVDDQHAYKSVDLFCRPFYEKTKSAESTLKELHRNLESFGIYSLSDVNIMCDRGSNFQKAFKGFHPLFCFGHRLNNVVKRSFFQSQANKKSSAVDHGMNVASAVVTKATSSISPGIDSKDELSMDDSDATSDEDFESITAIPVLRRKKEKVKTADKSSRLQIDLEPVHFRLTIDDVPLSAKQVLCTLNQCKKIVKYVKKSGMNKEIEGLDGSTLHQSCVVRWLSMSDLLESVLKSFKLLKRMLIAKNKQSMTTHLNERTIKQLVLILKPFKHIMKIIQTGKSPSLYMVVMCTITLREVFSSYDALLNYYNEHCCATEGRDGQNLDEDLEFELEGIKWFRERILALSNEMITLDVRHYCATLLHPKYRLLKNCTENERVQCHKYIREQLNLIRSTTAPTLVQESSGPPTKKFKKNEDIFSRFEDDHPLNTGSTEDDQSGNESDEYDYDSKQSDELDRYLIMDIDKATLSSDPLIFWKAQSQQFPLLLKLAKQIHSIPATSSSVERQFSAAGLVINERRTNLGPHQLDNILLIRSVKKLN